MSNRILILLEILSDKFWKIIWSSVEYESFLESDPPDILDLCEKNLDESIDAGNLFVIGYLPLIWKDSVTHMHALAVYVKEELPFACDASLENYTFLVMF